MKYIVLLLTTIFSTSCTTLTVHDFTVCADAGVSGSVCDDYLTSHQVLLDKPEWDALRFGWLCVSPDDYGSIKTELEDACSLMNCSYEQKQKLKVLFKKVEALRIQIQKH